MTTTFHSLFPRIWGRWWAARLLATTSCSKWLHAGNPTFTRWQRTKRNSLCMLLFLLPCKLPVEITISRQQEKPR